MKRSWFGVGCCATVLVWAVQTGFAQSDLMMDGAPAVETPEMALDMEALADPVPAVEPTSVAPIDVRLQTDGLLAGRFRLMYATGKSEPANATVILARGGESVVTGQTDSTGSFRLAGLEPGAYEGRAIVGEKSAEFSVEVLAYDPAAAPDEMLLQGTLTPIPDAIMAPELVLTEEIVPACGGCGDCGLCGVVAEEVVEAPCMAPCAMGSSCGGGFAGGGCCGGGGWGGGLLGLGGLAAGITALALDDDNPPVAVSPSAP